MRTETSHIWLGQFGESAPSDFFVERYDRDDDEPLSAFAASQGEVWYDHDFVEMSYVLDLLDIASLVTGHSYADQYLEEVVARARQQGIDRANGFILATAAEFKEPCTLIGAGYRLWYLGTVIYAI